MALQRPRLLLLLLFVALNVLLLALADPGCRTVGATCALAADRTGEMVVDALLKYGALVDPEAPSEPYVGHTPGHALVMAATFLMFGDQSYLPLIVLQLAFLFASGLLLHKAIDEVLPGYGVIAMGLYVFNPNVLAQVQLPQTNALEVPFVTIAFAAAILFARRVTLATALLCGAAVGLAMLMRPMSQFLVPLLPIVLPVLVLLGSNPAKWRHAVLCGVAAAGVSIAIASPWVLHMHAAGRGYHMSAPSHEHLLLLDSLRFLSPDAPGEDLPQRKVAFTQWQLDEMRRLYADWDSLEVAHQEMLLRDHAIAYFKTFPFEPSTMAVALAWSWIRFLVAGGEGELHRLLGLEGRAAEQPLAFYLVKAVALGTAVLLRLLGILGLIELLRRREWGVLLLCTGLILLFMAGTFLVGQPRYRVPVEAPLVVLATFGIAMLMDRLRRPRGVLSVVPR